VRGPGYNDGRGYFVSGNEATIHMKVEEFKRWLGECVSELIIANAKCDESTRTIIRKAITSAIDTPAAMPARTFVMKPPAWDAHHNRHHARVEERAREIYDAFVFDGVGCKTKPDWQPGGNSNKQDEARNSRGLNCARPATRGSECHGYAGTDSSLALPDVRHGATRRWSGRKSSMNRPSWGFAAAFSTS
jgi:hypothetical protein